MKLHHGILLSVALLVVGGAPTNAEDVPTPSSSLLTPAKAHEVFDALDLSSPELKPVADAIAAGNDTQAVHLLADYFRHRKNPAWEFHSHGDPTKDPVANDAVKGRLQGGLVRAWHTFPDNQVDWLYNETTAQPGFATNFEWQWQLCRMSFWHNLGDAYRATKNADYTQAWLKEFRSFVAECPPPDAAANNPRSAWRTIDSGIRMTDAWPTAFFSFLPSRQFSDEDVLLYLDSSLQHARYLAKFKTQGNWLTMEMCGLYTIGAYFPEFKDATAWRTEAVDRMHDEETAQFLPDGAQNELSTLYQNVVLDNFIRILRVAKQVGRLNELPDGYTAGLEKGFDFEVYLMTPQRSLPPFNDSAAYPKSVESRCREAAELFPDRTDYRWIASEGKEGAPPAETSHDFSWAGFDVMRSGWEPDANYLVFRTGPLGAAHSHQDKLNVVLWAYGRELLYNSGGASYEKSKWRDYSIETFSKNTVLVDGKPQVRDVNNREGNIAKAPCDLRWESTADHDFSAGVYDEGYGAVNARVATHTRRVLFIKPDLYVVADSLAPIDAAPHTYQARWNLLTTQSEQDATTKAVATTDKDLPNLAIVPLQPDDLEVRTVSAQTDPELLGWSVRKDVTPQSVPATTITHTRKGAGPQSFLTLLVPLRAGAASPVKSVTATAPESASVTFGDGRVLVITADPDPHGGIEVAETLPGGAAGRHIKAGATAAGVVDQGPAR